MKQFYKNIDNFVKKKIFLVNCPKKENKFCTEKKINLKQMLKDIVGKNSQNLLDKKRKQQVT